MNPLIHLKKAAPVFLVALACFGLLPKAYGVLPAPDGGYAGGNTAEGQSALFSLTTGGFNTAVGLFSLRTLTTGSFNTTLGAGTLLANTADQNTAIGAGALLSNSTGSQNTANGAFALFSNTTGSDNTATGFQALEFSTGNFNNAFGRNALVSLQSGDGNVAVGDSTLSNANSCNNNTAIGNSALTNSFVGNYNIALGFFAGANTNGDNNILIGNAGVVNQANAIYIGNNTHAATYIAGIYGDLVTTGGIAVYVGPDGQLGTNPSSRRFKTDVQPMDNASKAILRLKPIKFHYSSDKTGTPQFGLIAEEVAKVNPDLVVRDKNGEIYTVRYDAVNAMLLNEFLKEHQTVQEQGATIARQQKQIDALAAGLQKVSAQLEASKPAPEVVNDP